MALRGRKREEGGKRKKKVGRCSFRKRGRDLRRISREIGGYSWGSAQGVVSEGRDGGLRGEEKKGEDKTAHLHQLKGMGQDETRGEKIGES